MRKTNTFLSKVNSYSKSESFPLPISSSSPALVPSSMHLTKHLCALPFIRCPFNLALCWQPMWDCHLILICMALVFQSNLCLTQFQEGACSSAVFNVSWLFPRVLVLGNCLSCSVTLFLILYRNNRTTWNELQRLLLNTVLCTFFTWLFECFNSLVSTTSSSLLDAFHFQHRYFFFCKAPKAQMHAVNCLRAVRHLYRQDFHSKI